VLSSGNDLPCVADSSVDAIWSFDVFVHAAPIDQAGYLAEIARVLTPGGVAVIHHADGRNLGAQPSRSGWRTPMSRSLFATSADQQGLAVEAQIDSWGEGGRYDLSAYHDAISVCRKPTATDSIGRVPDRLHFTESDEANELIATDSMALLVGFALDQQVPVQKAFMGPLVLRERLGSLDAAALASADLEPLFRAKPAIHRFPGAMAGRVHELAVHIRERYDGDAARVWTDASDADALRANLEALPGFGEMKVKALGSVLAKRFGIDAANGLVPWHPTLGDVDSMDALERYQAAKKMHKSEWSTIKA